MCTTCIPGSQKRGSDHCPGTGVMDGFQPPCRYCDWYPGPMQEQVLLTTES